jgi:hypothetical protein
LAKSALVLEKVVAMGASVGVGEDVGLGDGVGDDAGDDVGDDVGDVLGVGKGALASGAGVVPGVAALGVGVPPLLPLLPPQAVKGAHKAMPNSAALKNRADVLREW